VMRLAIAAETSQRTGPIVTRNMTLVAHTANERRVVELSAPR